MTTLDSNVPVPGDEPPKEEPKKKPRARRPKVAALNPAASLIAALKFVSVAQKKNGTPQQQHCMVSGHWVAASNGILTVATRVVEDLEACPHTFSFLDALSKVGDELAITQLSGTALAVTSGAFKAVVPCALAGDVTIAAPDPQIAAIDDRVKASLAAVMGLAADGATSATYAAVLLQANTAVATNGFALLEHWHGIDLPPGLMIPKASAVAITKTDKALAGFGFSQSSATFWFEDGSFIKTQLFGERYPNYQAKFADVNPWPVPDEFYKAVRYIESFSKNGIVYFNEGVLSSNDLEHEASTYRIEGLPEGMGFNAKYLLAVEHAFKSVFFDETANTAYFFGENVRGVLMGVERNVPQPERTDESNFTDDIPF